MNQYSTECVAVVVHAILSCTFYTMAGILWIPKLCNAFYGMHNFLEGVYTTCTVHVITTCT